MEEPIAGTVELKCEWAVNSCRGCVLCTDEGPWRLPEWREDAAIAVSRFAASEKYSSGPRPVPVAINSRLWRISIRVAEFRTISHDKSANQTFGYIYT